MEVLIISHCPMRKSMEMMEMVAMIKMVTMETGLEAVEEDQSIRPFFARWKRWKEKEQKMLLDELNYLLHLDSKEYTLNRRERTKSMWKFLSITLKVSAVMGRSTSTMMVKE